MTSALTPPMVTATALASAFGWDTTVAEGVAGFVAPKPVAYRMTISPGLAIGRPRFGNDPAPEPLQVIESGRPFGHPFQNVRPQGARRISEADLRQSLL